ncbi:hypothetical protein LZU96_08625 [Pantoea agglomerans]|uniref:hypothetical protein n=1 Tax=Pantoea TaxID=53335 RepID=UPI001F34105F|nr:MULTISPECIES: hypothetical protein [Pantoea]UIL53974.1 hypothetical protein LZU96_08625 [Pantoea agglomerans]
MGDVSDDSQTTSITADEATHEVNEQKQALRFRSIAFYGACAIVCAFLLALLYWLVVWPMTSLDLHKFAGGVEDPKKYADFISQTKILWTSGIVVLAAIPTTLALALLRFAFSKSSKEDKDDIPSVWLSLAKEVADIIKQYVSKK